MRPHECAGASACRTRHEQTLEVRDADNYSMIDLFSCCRPAFRPAAQRAGPEADGAAEAGPGSLNVGRADVSLVPSSDVEMLRASKSDLRILKPSFSGGMGGSRAPSAAAAASCARDASKTYARCRITPRCAACSSSSRQVYRAGAVYRAVSLGSVSGAAPGKIAAGGSCAAGRVQRHQRSSSGQRTGPR